MVRGFAGVVVAARSLHPVTAAVVLRQEDLCTNPQVVVRVQCPPGIAQALGVIGPADLYDSDVYPVVK